MSLNDDSMIYVRAFISCTENAILFHSIYKETGFEMSLKNSMYDYDDITRCFVQINDEKVFLIERDFEGEFFSRLSSQKVYNEKQQKIIKAIQSNISAK